MSPAGTPGEATPPGVWRPRANPWLIALAVMLATFMEVLDTSIASVALPYIAGNLGATREEATWVLTSYLVSNAIVLPASAWFSSVFGRKRFLITCIIIFTCSSFICGAATSLGMLIVARIAQGAGGGALQPLSQAILLEKLSARAARCGHGGFRGRCHLRSNHRADARGLAHGQLFMALGFLHQHPGRGAGGVPHFSARRRSPLYSRGSARPARLDRFWPGEFMAGHVADHPGQRPGGGLVWRGLVALVHRHFARLDDGLHCLGTLDARADCEFAGPQEPQLRRGLRICTPASAPCSTL